MVDPAIVARGRSRQPSRSSTRGCSTRTGDVRRANRLAADDRFVIRDLVAPPEVANPLWFSIAITLWLWFTVLFANFAEAVAEGPWQGAGRLAAPRCAGDRRAPRRGGKRPPRGILPASQLRRATSSSSSRTADHGRRRDRRGHRVGRRVRDHRRVRARDPRIRRRTVERDRRQPRCCPIGSSFASVRIPARRSSIA